MRGYDSGKVEIEAEYSKADELRMTRKDETNSI